MKYGHWTLAKYCLTLKTKGEILFNDQSNGADRIQLDCVSHYELHCLPPRLKLKFFEIFSNGEAQKSPVEQGKNLKNVDFRL